MWEVEYTHEFGEWFDSLEVEEQRKVVAAVDLLEQQGPTLGRPTVENVHSSRHPNMKELRPRGSYIRILFAFDPRRMAMLLIGGDKSGRWREWYDVMVPIADRLYDEHIETLKREGLLP